MPRQARIDAPGALHHIIARGIDRTAIFDDPDDYTFFIERLRDLLIESDTQCFAWALLPNHFHLLLRTGNIPISVLMKRLLTAYAIHYNRRHRRVGHLFQNRYKSILCQEDSYLLELVRYIHLNPLRAKIVQEYKRLSKHPFSGHGVILGQIKNDWQNRQYVLRLFGKKKTEAKSNYSEFVRKGIELGPRPELTGGGLLRSQGGWASLKANRRAGNYQKGDERILGDGDFVKEVLKQADERLQNRYRMVAEGYDITKLCKRISEITNISPRQLLDGQRDRLRTQARSILCYWATDQLGISQMELAQMLKQTQPAISQAVRRGRLLADKNGWTMMEE
ncbi:MAG: transposase [Desulfobacteraceae bacterium]|nr:transposase [Desulfobacteraceae bacterium]